MCPHKFADEKIAEYLEKNSYHPRSDRHGAALCGFFLDDLLFISEKISDASKQGNLVFRRDYVVGEGTRLEWNVDLVLGPPIEKPLFVPQNVSQGVPGEIWLAIDAKSIMTEHGKARRNRQRDLNSFASIMKHHYPRSVVGGMMVVNIANKFKSPLRPSITPHVHIDRLVDETVQLFSKIPLNQNENDVNIDGVAVIIVEHSNIIGDKTRLISEKPAPLMGNPTQYRTFLDHIKNELEHRFFNC
jgi:hypothetical protein